LTINGRMINGNFVAQGEHVPEAERNNRVIQERTRSAFHSMPYQAIPKILLKALVMECTRKLNFFPPKGGVSPYYSPRELVTNQRLHYSKQCTIPLLAYVQSAEDEQPRKNNQKSRALDCLYVRPLYNHQGGHQLYNIATGRMITRQRVTVVPITSSVITAIEMAAKADDQKGLVIRSKHGTIFYNSAWTAGVDYIDEVNEDDDVYDDEDYSYTTDSDESLHVDSDEETEGSTGNNRTQTHNTVQAEPQAEDDQNNNDQPSVQETDDDSVASEASTTEEQKQSDEEPIEEVPNRQPGVSRAGRKHKPTERMKTYKGISNAQTSENNTFTIKDVKEAQVFATVVMIIRERGTATKVKHGHQFVETYSLKRAINKFGEDAKQAAQGEMQQLQDRDCFRPISKRELTALERSRAVESLLFVVEKKSGKKKARFCANGSTQRTWMGRDDVSSPTVSTESTLLTATIDAKENRSVATCDIPNAFIQTTLTDHDVVGKRTIMKIRGDLVAILCRMDPQYEQYVEWEAGKPVLYVHVTKAIYGLLASAMLFYRKLREDLERNGFKVNPYDSCVANKTVGGKQLTVSWHVDDLKISCQDKKAVDDLIDWIKEKYGRIGEVKVNRTKVHEYLGIKLDYSTPGKVVIDTRDQVNNMLGTFPAEELKTFNVASPWTVDLFQVDDKSPPLPKEKAELFHTVTAQGLFICKRGRPDISPAIAYLTTRVREPNVTDWSKLVRLMKWVKKTKEDCLTLEASDDLRAKWYVDASFAVHPDFRSHTGAIMTIGKGAVISISRKQGINTRSSTESELVAADDVIGPLLWTRLFLQAQGYKQDNVMYQDNQSAMKLEKNGRASAGKRSRHINIRYFFVADMQEKKYLTVEYCPTDKMYGDYMTKPLHGQKFNHQRDYIMNLAPTIAAQMVMVACFRTRAIA
jgi:Reverse transcriptase (RNA-dependent DNA polymerase)